MKKTLFKILTCIFCMVIVCVSMLIPSFANEEYVPEYEYEYSREYPCGWASFPNGNISIDHEYNSLTPEQIATAHEVLCVGVTVGNIDSPFCDKVVIDSYRNNGRLDANAPSARGLYVEFSYYDTQLEKDCMRKSYFPQAYVYTRSATGGVDLLISSVKYNNSTSDAFGIKFSLREYESSTHQNPMYYMHSVSQFNRVDGVTTDTLFANTDSIVITFYGWNYYNDGLSSYDVYGDYMCNLNPILRTAFYVLETPEEVNGFKEYVGAYDDGYQDGDTHGYNNGLQKGYGEGVVAGEEYGFQNGYNEGFTDGEKYGYDNGFGAGQDDMAKTTESFKDMVFAIFDAPTTLINGMLNFDIFGINLASLVKTLITLGITAVVITIIIKFVKG